MKKLLILLSLCATKLFSAPSVLERQAVFAAKYLSETVGFCSVSNPSITPAVAQLAKKIQDGLKVKSPETLRIEDLNRIHIYRFSDASWNTQDLSPQIKEEFYLTNSALYADRRFPRSINVQVASTSRQLLKQAVEFLKISVDSATLDDLGLCVESNMLKNTEIVTGGFGETNIALITILMDRIKWPAFPRIAITDGKNFWDLSSQVAGISRPLSPIKDKIIGVSGLAINHTQLTRHISPQMRAFLLPIMQWNLVMEKGNPSVYIPEEYLELKFERKWDSKKKESYIEENSLSFGQKQVMLVSGNPTHAFHELPEDIQNKLLKAKLNFFGLLEEVEHR